MSDADTKRAIKAHAFDKIAEISIADQTSDYVADVVEDIVADAKAQMKVIDEQAKQRNR